MDSMKIAMSGLNAFRTAMGTASHNIANSQTEGYSRQRVEIQSNVPQGKDGIFTGNGAHVNSIRRINDSFNSEQIRSLSSEQQRLDAFHKMASRIDTMLAEDSTSLTPAMQEFFNAIEQLNTDPASPTTRQLVLTQGQNLVSRFHTQYKQVATLYDEVNGKIGQEVDEINSLAENLAQLNVAILNSGAQGSMETPNDLLDQQDRLLEQLAGHIGISVTKESNGMVSVFAGNGLSLVNSDRANLLAVGRDPADPTKSVVTQNGININDSLSGGSLGGVLDFRREMLDQTMNQLGRQATVLGMTFNEQHDKGIHLYEEWGGDFFKVDQPVVMPGHENSGGAAISAIVIDATKLTTSDYRVSYDGSNYTITRLSDEQQQTVAGLPADIDGLRIELDSGAPAAGDSFLIRPTINGAKNIGLAISNGSQIAAAAPMRATANIANIGDGTISTPLVIDKNAVEPDKSITIEFTSDSDFRILYSDGSSDTGSYTSNGEIAFNGLSVRIVGSPKAGDRFLIEPNKAGSSDNSNSRLLSDIQMKKVIEGSATLQEGYGNVVNNVGGLTRQTAVYRDAQETLLTNAKAVRDSISGVDLDEEAANLARYQQAYEAAAQVIAISKLMFDAVLDATRR